MGASSFTFGQLPNADFEDFGSQNIQTVILDDTAFNGQTCTIEGGVVTPGSNFIGNARPLGWSTTDDFFNNPNPVYVFEDDDSFSGSSAVRLQDDGFFGFGLIGLFRAEELVQENLPVAFPFTELPTSIDGYYRHSSGAAQTIMAGTCTRFGVLDQDTTFTGGMRVYARFFDDEGNLVATADATLTDAGEYTFFSVPVTATVSPAIVPTQLVLVFSSCPEFETPNPVYIPGSTSWLDDVAFTYGPSSLDERDLSESAWTLFPNPTNNLLRIRKEDPTPTHYRIYDAVGRIRMRGIVTQSATIEIANWPAGVYQITLAGGGTKTFVIR